MRSNRLYGAIAASLAMGLGLGLIYLYAVSRIDAFTAIFSVVGVALLMIVLTALADVASEDRRRTRSRPRLPAHRS